MSKEKFILVSLKEEESKKLAQIITNDTSRKLLDYLAEKEATESELAEKLNIPISTIHYNLQALVNGKLVEADEYHYSKKGKEILHYKLANKYIIIAPKSTFGIREKLKKILPVGLIALAGSSIIYFIDKMNQSLSATKDMMFAAGGGALERATAPVESAIEEAVISTSAATNDAIPQAMKAVAESAPILPEAAQRIAEPLWQTFLQNPALWFLTGCIFTLILIIIIEFIAYKRQNK